MVTALRDIAGLDKTPRATSLLLAAIGIFTLVMVPFAGVWTLYPPSTTIASSSARPATPDVDVGSSGPCGGRCTIVFFDPYDQPIKSLLLGTKRVFQHQDLQMCGLKLKRHNQAKIICILTPWYVHNMSHVHGLELRNFFKFCVERKFTS